MGIRTRIGKTESIILESVKSVKVERSDVKVNMTIGPMFGVSGSGQPEQMKQQLTQGWQAKWKPEDYQWCECDKNINPLLVRGIALDASDSDIESAVKVFGAIKEVFRPEGESFAFVHYVDSSTATAAANGIKKIKGQTVQVQPAKRLCKEVVDWRARLRKENTKK